MKTCVGREVLGARPCGRLSDMMSPSVSVEDKLGTTQGSTNLGNRHTVSLIMFNMETSCRGLGGGKGKNPISQEYLRIPTPTLV